MASQQFCLKWNNHTSNMLNIFESLLLSESLVDVTLACDGLILKAHKVVLSACSSFFHDLFISNPCQHPIVIMKDIDFKDLKTIVNFMYKGEVDVSQDQLSTLLKAAETLKVKGLAEVSSEQSSNVPKDIPTSVPSTSQQLSLQKGSDFDSGSLHSRRKRPCRRKQSLSDDDDNSEVLRMEEISKDISMKDVPSIHSPDSSVHCSSSKHHLSKSSYLDSQVTIEDSPSEDKPFKLMEQTISHQVTIGSASTPSHFNLPPLSGIEIFQKIESNQMKVPDPTRDPCHIQKFENVDSPPDIKPNIHYNDLEGASTFQSDGSTLLQFDHGSMPSTSSGFSDVQHGSSLQDLGPASMDLPPSSSSPAFPPGLSAGAERTVKTKKRRRKLIVDKFKNISDKEMKSQLSDTSDTVTSLHLAPPTKRLMHWKEKRGAEKLFVLPGHKILSKTLSRIYQRHLTSFVEMGINYGDRHD